MKKIMLFLCLAALLLPIGCKKSEDVEQADYTGDEFNQLAMTITPQQIYGMTDAKIFVEVKNVYPPGSTASLTITVTEGYVTGGDGKIQDNRTLIFHAPPNTTEYVKLVIVRANFSKFIGNTYVNRSVDGEIFILPQGDTKKLNFNKPFQYIDTRTGELKWHMPEVKK